MLPWAKANINPTGQALIISTVAGMAYFIAADKKILSLARRHSFENAPDRAPQEHLLPGHRPSPPGLLQAMIGSQARKTRAALRSSLIYICIPCMLDAIITRPLQSRPAGSFCRVA
jgi:hypothetical protein